VSDNSEANKQLTTVTTCDGGLSLICKYNQ